MVSIIIPNYNHAPYLKRRIDSVLAQTYEDYELIILDDKSTDNSCEVIDNYKNNPKVSKIIYNEENSGSTFKQWNKGISLAKGEYIWIAESDDIADPTLLETLFTGIKETDATIAYCDLYKIDSKDNNTGNWRYRYQDNFDTSLFHSDFSMIGEEYINNYLSFENTIPNASGVLFSKDAYLAIGGADEDIRYCADWLLWLKLLTKGKVFYTNQKLNYFRRHEGSVITSLFNDNNSNNNVDLFREKYTILMKLRYLEFLKERKDKTSFYKHFKNTIANDSMIEFIFLWKNKKYKKALSYLYLSFTYSSDLLFIPKYILFKLKNR